MNVPEILRAVDLNEEIAKFDPNVAAGRRAEILLKVPELRVVLTSMIVGTETQQHSVPGPITLQGLTGRFTVRYGETDYDLPPGAFLALRGGVEHVVRCEEEGAFLLTIAWDG